MGKNLITTFMSKIILNWLRELRENGDGDQQCTI